MTRPRLLDLFCGGGGAAAGYARAGFDVVGVDLVKQPRYPFDFVQEDAMRVLDHLVRHWSGKGTARALGYEFDAVHASPPCHDHTKLNVAAIDHQSGWLLPATRDRLLHLGVPWVIENVVGSGLPEQDDLLGANGVLLCGSMFGLPLYRHRLFETSFAVAAPNHPRHLVPASKAGHWVPGTIISVAGNCAPIALAREAMGGVDWMTRDELAESIPPAYTEFVGSQLLAALASGEAA